MLSLAHQVVPLVVIVVGSSLGLACGEVKPNVIAPHGAMPSDAMSSEERRPTPEESASDVHISDEIRTKCGISDEDAYFAFNSASVTKLDRSPLDQVANCFTAGPLKGRAVKLVGRADPRGLSDYNMTLGQSRADAVGVYLTARGMIKAKTQSTSRGAMDAVGTTEASWHHDRRVDVVLSD
jgi:peptidoglycan-associated lipoprotein